MSLTDKLLSKIDKDSTASRNKTQFNHFRNYLTDGKKYPGVGYVGGGINLEAFEKEY